MPSSPSSDCVNFLWKMSGTALIPIAILSHLNLPNRSGRMSLMVGWGKWLYISVLFSGIRSIHIVSFPFDFCIVTRQLIQSVLSSTGMLILLLWRSFRSSICSFIMATGTFLLGSFTGSKHVSIYILYSPCSQPSPLNTSTYSFCIPSIDKWHCVGFSSLTILCMANMFTYCTLISLIASLAFLPSSGTNYSSYQLPQTPVGRGSGFSDFWHYPYICKEVQLGHVHHYNLLGGLQLRIWIKHIYWNGMKGSPTSICNFTSSSAYLQTTVFPWLFRIFHLSQSLYHSL